MMKLSMLIVVVTIVGPSSVVGLLLPMALIVGVSVRTSWDNAEARLRAGWTLGSVVVALILLIPWSLEALRPSGAILGPVFSGLGGGGSFGPLWDDLGFLDHLLVNPTGPTGPGGQLTGSLVALVVLIGALLLPREGRLREVRLLTLVVVVMGVFGGLVSTGWMVAPVASPAMWLVIPSVAISMNAVHLIAGLREEMPRYALGWRQAVVALGGVAIIIGVFGAWLPATTLWGKPTSTLAGATDEQSRSLQSFFVSTAEQVGDFRVLWLGGEWIDPIRAGMRPQAGQPFLVTSPEGLTMLDSQMPPTADGEERLDSLVDALLGRRLHLAGHLLAVSGVRYLVVSLENSDAMAALGRQRDISLQQQSGGVAIFENLRWLPRVVLAPPELAVAAAREEGGDIELMLADWIGGRAVPTTGAATFGMRLPRTIHPVLMLGDNFNTEWTASVGETELTHSRAFGWSNAWEVPAGADGELQLRFSGWWKRALWILFEALLLIVVVGAISFGNVETKGWLR
jgi:hypothetical protein